MSNIIDPSHIVTDERFPHTFIIWGNGAHARDLISRDLIPSGTADHPAYILTLPITVTESAVLELIKRGIPQSDIISLSGVMSKASNGVPSAHFLFGPGATGNLKMALATETFDENNVLVSSLIEKVRAKGIQIIETTKVEHDEKMAITQGLIHLWLVMIGDNKNKDIQNSLVRPWKTPVGTVVDMIHANPSAEIIIKKFFDSLPRHQNNVSRALKELVEESNIEKFWTPNSDRVMRYVRESGSDILVPEAAIHAIRTWLNTHGHSFLAREIRKIRGGV